MENCTTFSSQCGNSSAVTGVQLCSHIAANRPFEANSASMKRCTLSAEAGAAILNGTVLAFHCGDMLEASDAATSGGPFGPSNKNIENNPMHSSQVAGGAGTFGYPEKNI